MARSNLWGYVMSWVDLIKLLWKHNGDLDACEKDCEDTIKALETKIYILKNWR